MNEPLPPRELTEVAHLVDQRLTEVLTSEREKWATHDPRFDEAIEILQSVAQRGGKRLRAAFCYWSWYGSKGGTQDVDPRTDEAEFTQIINVCTAVELLHTFALIHDDVMDDSSMRRGHPTVHKAQTKRLQEMAWRGEPRRFGESVAVLVGNLGHVYSDQLLQDAPAPARKLWNNVKVELNLGQYLDIRSAAAGELDFATARQVAWYKSALYTIRRPMELGLAVSGASSDDLTSTIGRFSDPLGRAFQLRDDILGLFGDEVKLGKPIGDDIRDAKATELIAFARQKANPEQSKLLDSMGSATLTGADIAAIVEVIRATGAVGYVDHEIENLVVSAESVLGELPYSPVAKRALSSLAHYVASRNL